MNNECVNVKVLFVTTEPTGLGFTVVLSTAVAKESITAQTRPREANRTNVVVSAKHLARQFGSPNLRHIALQLHTTSKNDFSRPVND